MRILDAPVRLAAGRTVRELVLIGSGVASIAVAIHLGDKSWNVYVYALTTALFAGRFFAARVLYLSMCVGALALQLSCALMPSVTLADKAPVLIQILGLCLLLSGKDLLRRFDDTGRGLGPLRNFWGDLSVGQRRHLAWGMHLVGATGGLLHHMAYNVHNWGSATPLWLDLAVAGCAAVGLLYLSGRAIAAPAAVALGVALVWHLAPRLEDSFTMLEGRPVDHPVPIEHIVSAHYTIGAAVCAAAAAAIALPWTYRWLRLAFRG